MAHVRTATNGNVKFKEICGQSLGWFGTKGTFLQHHMLGFGLRILRGNSLLMAVLKNHVFRDIQIVVFADKDLAAGLFVLMITIMITW